jgi:hypothetical protein
MGNSSFLCIAHISCGDLQHPVLQAKVSSAESEARRQSDLVTRLETDLAAVKGAGG